MKKWRISRETVLEAAIIGLALARVCVVPNLWGDTAWRVMAHVIRTAGLVCCVLWWSDWKKNYDAKNKKEEFL